MKADYSKIIRDSIQITQRNKKLWVMGLVLATLTAGSSGGSGGGGSSSESKKTDKKEPNGTMERSVPGSTESPVLLNSNLLSANLPQVLGTATSSLSALLKTIPVSFYVALVVLILIGVALGIAVSLYGQAWSQSGLIRGIERENSGESLSLKQMSDHGKIKAVEIIKIKVIPMLIFLAASFGTGMILLAAGTFFGSAGKVIATLLTIIWFIVLLISAILVSASVHLGVLAINLEALPWKDGYKRGQQVFKSFFMDVVIMSFINCCSGCIVGLGTLIVLGLFIGIGVLTIMGVVAMPPFIIAAGPIIFLLIIALVFIMGLVNAIFTVFKQSTWVLLYKQLTEEPSGQQ